MIILFLIGIHTYRKRVFVYIITASVFLVLFAGLRGKDVSSDYSTYSEYFQNIHRQRSLQFISLIEPTFIFVSYYLPTVRAVMIFFSLLAISFKLVAFNRLTPFVFFSVAIWFSSFFLVQEMNQIRAAVATGLLLLSIPSIIDKKALHFFLIIFVASLFHYSALVFIPIYFLNSIKVQFLYFLIIPVSYLLNALGIGFLDILKHVHITIVESKLEDYNTLYSMGMYTKINIYNPIILLRILIIYGLLLNTKKIHAKNRYYIILVKSYVISISILVLFSTLPAFSLRVSDIFGIVEIILLPFFLYVYNPKFLIILLLFMFSAFILSIDLFYNKFLNPYSL